MQSKKRLRLCPHRDAVLQLLHPSLELAVSEVLVAVVDCLELAAIDGRDHLGEELQAAA